MLSMLPMETPVALVIIKSINSGPSILESSIIVAIILTVSVFAGMLRVVPAREIFGLKVASVPRTKDGPDAEVNVTDEVLDNVG